jgi:hypothetical protein
MRHFVWFFLVLILFYTTNLAFAAQENQIHTKAHFPDAIKIGEKAKFSVKLTNVGYFFVSDIKPVIEVNPKSASSFVHVDVNPSMTALWKGYSDMIYGTIYVDKDIPVERIFVSVYFVAKSGGKQTSLMNPENNAAIKIEKESPNTDSKSIFDFEKEKPTCLNPNSKTPLYGCNDVVTVKIDSPLKQFKSGIPRGEIQCRENLVVATKIANGNPVCVNPDSFAALVKRNWVENPLDDILDQKFSKKQRNDLFYEIMNYPPLREWSKSGWEFKGFNRLANDRFGFDYSQISLELPAGSGLPKAKCEDGDGAWIAIDLKTLKIVDAAYPTDSAHCKMQFTKTFTVIHPVSCDEECKKQNEARGLVCYYIDQNSHYCKKKEAGISDIIVPRGADEPIFGRNFIPSQLVTVIGVNSTVKWTNANDSMITITSDTRGYPFDSISLKPNESFTLHINKVGEYWYHAEPGPWLHGVIIVKENEK